MAWLLLSSCQPENMYNLLGLVGWNAAHALVSLFGTPMVFPFPFSNIFAFSAADNEN